MVHSELKFVVSLERSGDGRGFNAPKSERRGGRGVAPGPGRRCRQTSSGCARGGASSASSTPARRTAHGRSCPRRPRPATRSTRVIPKVGARVARNARRACTRARELERNEEAREGGGCIHRISITLMYRKFVELSSTSPSSAAARVWNIASAPPAPLSSMNSLECRAACGAPRRCEKFTSTCGRFATWAAASQHRRSTHQQSTIKHYIHKKWRAWRLFVAAGAAHSCKSRKRCWCPDSRSFIYALAQIVTIFWYSVFIPTDTKRRRYLFDDSDLS